MSDLLNKKCVPCEGGILPFDISEIHKYQKKGDGWDVKKKVKEIYFLEKNFIKNKDIRNFKKNYYYYLFFRLIRNFLNRYLEVKIYNFKIFASNKKNITSHSLLKKCIF